MSEPRKAIFRTLTIIVFSVVTLGPLVWFILLGFASRESTLAGWPRLADLTLGNYKALAERLPLAQTIGDTAQIALGSGLISIFLAIPASYFASRGRGRLAHQVYTLSLTLWLVPPIALSLEVYFWFLRLHIYDTTYGLAMLHGVLHATLVLIILTPYLDAVPRRIDEVAWMDGVGGLRVLGAVYWPLLRYLILGLFALAFVRSWNELLFSTILTNSQVRTLPISMLGLTSGSHLEWGQVAALGTISLAPVPIALAVFYLWQFSRTRQIGGGIS
jgi:multiple sugar transport system permease protein